MAFLDNGVTGHRGNPQSFPENTITGFISAIELGCDWVETDLRLTRDGRIVLSHDTHTGFLAEKRLVLAESDFSELRKLNMATYFNQVHCDRTPYTEHIATLEEALEVFRSQSRCRLSLQPKEPETLPLVRKIVNEMNIPDELIGFNDGIRNTVITARELFPGSVVFYDIRPQDLAEELAVAEKYHFQEIVTWEYGITPDVVAQVKARGMVPGVWTPNAPAEMEHFLAMGCERFYTDFPAVLLQKLRK
jgi:glycerophosphoryl diester phosphodiesterase